MVVVNQRRRVRRPREAWRDSIRGVHVATKQESHDSSITRRGHSWGSPGTSSLNDGTPATTGAYDPLEARKVQRLAMLIPFARRTRP